MGKRKHGNMTPPSGMRSKPGNNFKTGGKKISGKKYACGGKMRK